MWLFQAPYPNSMVLTRDKDALQKTFALLPTFFPNGTESEFYNRGDQTIQTSRWPEISKIWFTASRGESCNGVMFELMEKNRRDFIHMFRNSSNIKNFYPVKLGVFSMEISCYYVPTFSFYYVPDNWVGREDEGQPFIDAITEMTVGIAHQLRRQGLLDLTVGSLPEGETLPKFFTISFTNTRFAFKPMGQWIINTIDQFGRGNFNGVVLPPEIDLDNENTTVPFPNFPHRKTYEDMVNTIIEATFQFDSFNKTAKAANLNARKARQATNNDGFDFGIPYNEGLNLLNKIINLFDSVVNFSPSWPREHFIDQFPKRLDPYTIIADLLAPLLNTPMITFTDSAAKPFLLMESELVQNVGQMVYGAGFDGDGTLTDGGSMANQLAIALARVYKNPSAFKYSGHTHLFVVTPYFEVYIQKYHVYISGDAHYSTIKGLMIQGVGRNNTIIIESNEYGQMNADKLELAIEESLKERNIPLMVVITAGTSIYGAIDPIDDIVDVCQKFNIWCHVDASFGGLVILSEAHRDLLSGIEGADSWAANLHKLMGSSMICTIFLTKYKNAMVNAFTLPHASDTAQEDPYVYDNGAVNLDLVGRHPQLDKRNNVFKFWFLWKAKGREGLEAHVDRLMSIKNYFVREIRAERGNGLQLLIPTYNFTNVCFLVAPPHLDPLKNRSITTAITRTPAWLAAMDSFQEQLENEFLKVGISSFVTQTRHMVSGSHTQKFIKLVMLGPALTPNDPRAFVNAVLFYSNLIGTTRIARKKVDGESRTGMALIEDLHSTHPKEDGDLHTAFDPFGNLPHYYSKVFKSN